jgi:hypothetical protein
MIPSNIEKKRIKKKKKYNTVGTIPKIKYQYCRKMIIKCVLDACAQEKLEAK